MMLVTVWHFKGANPQVRVFGISFLPNFHEAFTQLHLDQLLASGKCPSRDRRDGGIDSKTYDILRDIVSTLATSVDKDLGVH
jgi:hypothetical protein